MGQGFYFGRMIRLFLFMEGKKITGLGKGARGCLRALYRASSVKYLLLVLQAAPSWLVGTSKFGGRYNNDFFFFFWILNISMSLSHSFRSLGINFQNLDF